MKTQLNYSACTNHHDSSDEIARGMMDRRRGGGGGGLGGTSQITASAGDTLPTYNVQSADKNLMKHLITTVIPSASLEKFTRNSRVHH